jgi:hypothetical protein
LGGILIRLKMRRGELYGINAKLDLLLGYFIHLFEDSRVCGVV